MVAREHRTGIYVCIPLYLIMMAAVAFWANERMRRMDSKATDAISNHFIGGRMFGPVVTTGTFFASLYSGYTVVGIPNEAFSTGFQSFRWLPAIAMSVAGVVGTGVRLRKASVVRNHQSPVDFITDRFQSQMLRYVIVWIQVVAGIIYLAAQVNSLKGTFNSMFGLDPDDPFPVIVMMITILLFEWMGGLSSVALTDAIQGVLMVLSFILLPLVMVRNFGGWTDLNPETYPQPEFYQTPTKDQQWMFWQFSMVLGSFFTLPHLLQRVYSARDMSSLKTGWCWLTVSPWLTMFVGVFIGTIGVQMLADAGVENPVNPFTSVLEEVMNIGGFAKGVGTIAFAASLAAIMSTADSLIIAVSHLITVEVIYPMRPEASPKYIAWCGRVTSLFAMILALLIGILWKDGVAALSKINFSVSSQAVPTFLLGLYASESWNVHPWSLAAAAFFSIVFVIVTYFAYIFENSDTLPIDLGTTGVTINITLICLFEAWYRYCARRSDDATESDESSSREFADKPSRLIHPNRPAWDVPKLQRFGDCTLTPRLLNKMMIGIEEPFYNGWYLALLFFSITLVTPLVAAGQPALDEGGVFVSSPSIVNGLPMWFFKQVLICGIAFVVIGVGALKTPSMFPEAVADKNGYIDPNVVEMTREELGRRRVYDERNELVHRRRMAIRKEMETLGLESFGG